ncbi:MAG TPA: DUF1385 domain-containing protein [Clostridiaceae bacterium]|nr:DUF1385 domain-containing protein [Clostridiaceae bacterium]
MDKEIWKKPKICSNIGGQALIEGVMMRGNDRVAVSVRKSTGEIHTEIKQSVPLTKKNRFFGLPFIRGGVSFIDSMVVGIRTLMDSAELVDLGEEEEKESKFDIWMKKKLGENYFSYMLYFSVFLALAFSIAVFVLLPNAAVSFFNIDKSSFGGSLLASTLEGLIRVGLFILYVWLVSKNRDIKRVFQYHGAEHKTIYAYENDEELTLENVRKHTTLHPRCGTTFIFIVLIISSLIFAFTGWHNRLVNLVIRLALLPLIAGISYEAFKLSARSDSKLVRIISVPGLWLQKITTSEPDDSMIEVAIASLKAVLQEQPVTES